MIFSYLRFLIPFSVIISSSHVISGVNTTSSINSAMSSHVLKMNRDFNFGFSRDRMSVCVVMTCICAEYEIFMMMFNDVVDTGAILVKPDDTYVWSLKKTY